MKSPALNLPVAWVGELVGVVDGSSHSKAPHVAASIIANNKAQPPPPTHTTTSRLQAASTHRTRSVAGNP